MLLRRAPGFVAALILLPLSILAPAIPGSTWMICRMTGTAVPADCIEAAAGDKSAEPTPLHDGWLTGSCCEVLKVTFARPPAETQLGAPVAPMPRVAADRSQAPPLATARAIETGARAPSGPGQPRRFVTQSFLI